MLDAIESTNPYLFAERSAARSRLGNFGGAADDAVAATVEFKDIGDRLRSLIALADSALALGVLLGNIVVIGCDDK